MNRFKNLPFLLLALISLAGGISILIFFPRHPFIRGTLGDVIVMTFLFGTIKTFWKIKRDFHWILGLFFFALLLEILQATGIFQWIKNRSSWGTLITGNTFDWWDTLAYFCGSLLNLLFSTLFSKKVD